MISDKKSTAAEKQTEGIEKMNSKKKLLASVVGFFVAGGGQLAVAQDDGEELGWLLEEIVVTASKRSTSLQDTALSVSTISEDTLANLGITSFDQILATVPGATVFDSGPGTSRMSFRGVSTAAGGSSTSSQTFNNTTSTYIDEFPLSKGDVDIKMVDIARVEVLKGPQGTLYGQSALSGVMRFITNKPDFESVSGKVEAGVSSVASGDTGYQAQGHLNVPLSDNVAVRGVFYQYDTPGYIDNLNTGTDDINSAEVTGGRLALRWAVSDRTEFNLLYLNQSQELGGGQGSGWQNPTSTYTPVDNGDPTDIGPPDLSDPSYRSNMDAIFGHDFEVLNLKVDVNFEGFDLSLMGATKEVERVSKNDAGIWLGFYDDVTNIFEDWPYEYDTDTFEVRLVSNGDGPLDWIAGMWYEKEEGFIPYFVETRTPRDDLWTADGDVLFNTTEFDDSEELAFYGEVGYQLTDKAKLTVGYRRADIELDSGLLSAEGLFDDDTLVGADESAQEDVDTYKVHFEYAMTEDALVYALASSGYRAGGFNRGGLLSSERSEYGSDTIWNYEVGTRTSWMDSRLIVNAVAYYIDWSDIQQRTFDPVTLGNGVDNAGKAEVFGLETEVSYLVADNLRLSMNYSYIDAALAEDYLDPDTGAFVVAEDGDRLPGSSRNTFSLFVDWQTPLTSSLDLQVNANYLYEGSRVNQLGSIRPILPDDRTIPNLQIINLTAGVSHLNGVTISLFANNVLDERNPRTESGIGTALETVTMNRPRTVGLRASYQF